MDKCGLLIDLVALSNYRHAIKKLKITLPKKKKFSTDKMPYLLLKMMSLRKKKKKMILTAIGEVTMQLIISRKVILLSAHILMRPLNLESKINFQKKSCRVSLRNGS